MATDSNSSEQSNINKLAMELTGKLTEVNKLLVNLRAQTSNKEVKSHMCVFSASSGTRNKGETNPNRMLKNRIRKQRKRDKNIKRSQIAIESCKHHIKHLMDEQISLLSRGLKFIPTPATNEGLIRRNLLKDFNLFRKTNAPPIHFSQERKQTTPLLR